MAIIKIQYKKVIYVLCYFGHKTVHKFIQIHTNTPNATYYRCLQLNIQYEYCTTLILHKTSARCVKTCYLNKLI